MTNVPYVAGYCIDTPRCICIRVRDPDIQRESPRVVQLGAPVAVAYNTLTTLPDGKKGIIMGPNKDYKQYFDTCDGPRLDRDAVSNIFDPADSTIISAYTFDSWLTAHITMITRQSTKINDFGTGYDGVKNAWALCQYEHWIRFHTDADIPEGTAISIAPPSAAFDTVAFTFTSKDLWSPAIKFNCHGISPYDPAKYAYLSHFLPYAGNHGVVDFTAFDINLQCKVIKDSDGSDDSGLFPFTLHVSETDNVQGVGAGLQRVSSTNKPWPITAITKANPCVITIDTAEVSAPSVGDRVAPQYCTGMNEINSWPYHAATGNGSFISITAVTDNLDGTHDITIGAVNSSGYGTYTGEGKLFATTLVNWLGTKEYRADISTWEPSQLNAYYRIYVPGLGTSQRFLVDASVWHAAAKCVYGGIYNTLNGVEKDGRFGLTQGRSFYGVPHYEGLALAEWGQEQVSGGTGAIKPWRTTATEFIPETGSLMYGGQQDAGDPDFYYGALFDVAHSLMTREFLTASAWAVDLGWPTALDMFHPDDTSAATFWAGTDVCPDAMQWGIWMCEFGRKMRASTGEVRGGYDPTYGPTDPFRDYAPWELGQNIVYIYGPSILGTFAWAGLAAALSYIMAQDHPSLSTLASTLLSMAETSFAKALDMKTNADTFFKNYQEVILFATLTTTVNIDDTITDETSGATAVASDSATVGGGKTIHCTGATADLTPTFAAGHNISVGGSTVGTLTNAVNNYTANKNLITDNSRIYEAWAAAFIWRAGGTGDNYLGRVEDINTFEVYGANIYDWTSFIYSIVNDPARTLNYTQMQLDFARVGGHGSINNSKAAPFPSIAVTAIPYYGIMNPVFGMELFLRELYWVSKDNLYTAIDYHKQICLILSNLLGANPHNMSFVAGIGHQSIRNATNVPSEHLGLNSTPGLMAFTYMIQNAWSPDWYFGLGFWGSAPGAEMFMYRNQITGQDATRMPEPPPQALPVMQYMLENRDNIPMMEHSGHGLNWTGGAGLLKMHDVAGKGQTVQGERVRLRAA